MRTAKLKTWTLWTMPWAGSQHLKMKHSFSWEVRTWSLSVIISEAVTHSLNLFTKSPMLVSLFYSYLPHLPFLPGSIISYFPLVLSCLVLSCVFFSGAEEIISRVQRVQLLADQTVEDEKIAKVRTCSSHPDVLMLLALAFPHMRIAVAISVSLMASY